MHLPEASLRRTVASPRLQHRPGSSIILADVATLDLASARLVLIGVEAQQRVVWTGHAQFDVKGTTVSVTMPPAMILNIVQRSHGPPITRLARLGLLGSVSNSCVPAVVSLPSLPLQVSFDGRCCTSCRCLPLKHDNPCRGSMSRLLNLDMDLLAALARQAERNERRLGPYYFAQFQRE